jgi:hypothetical protein
MIILESSDPNFILNKDILIMTECGSIIELSKGEFLSVSKIDENSYAISNCCLLPKELKDKFFNEIVKNISHIQLEELDTSDLSCDGLFLQEYVNQDFDVNNFEFPKFENENTILSELKRISSLN